MSERVDAVVIGAGVVGLACARALARAGRETLILERHDAFGTEISARNSEVIHAGIYYPTGSAKARLCAAGRLALYRFCEEYGVSYRRCGKLIVASHPDQHDALAAIRSHAESNGVTDIHTLSADEARALEPNVNCSMALLSSSTGIVDSHSLMQALLGDAERHGAVLALKSPLAGGRVTADGIVLRVDGVEPIELTATFVVNAAGLSATAIAGSIEGFPAASIPRAWMAKGNYFTLSGKAPFSRLIYPVPEPGGLGVHLTLDLAGQARFGPDVEWIDAIDYTVNPARGLRFYDEVRKYWPGLPDGALQPAYAGIRPKISGPGMSNADFVIDGPQQHGVAGWVNLFGIESPGLTSCLAIGDVVREAIVAMRA